jgi:DNA-binding XRE family transcriptional regulator
MVHSLVTVDLRKHIRKMRGKRTLTKFAEDIGVSRQTLYNVMRGASEPSDKVLKAIGLTRSYRKEVETAA